MKDMRKTDFDNYSEAYSDSSFFDKILKVAKKAGISVIYAGLLLFYTLQRPLTPVWAKTTIIGALGYFISPLDLIPDAIPIAGYTDDLGALVLAIGAVAMYIDDETKKKAKAKLRDWFGDYDESVLKEIDDKIKKN